jgi:hypothetical protein
VRPRHVWSGGAFDRYRNSDIGATHEHVGEAPPATADRGAERSRERSVRRPWESWIFSATILQLTLMPRSNFDCF